jgi:hypothetical protein
LYINDFNGANIPRRFLFDIEVQFK